VTSSGVSFTEIVAQAEHVDAGLMDIGSRFAAAIPQPSVEAGGMRDAALWWAHHVGKVVPLWDASHPDDSKKANSAVLGSGWEVDDVATRDLAQVQEWWTNAPLANIGFASRANGILIVDLDPRHGGNDRFWNFCSEKRIDVSRVPRSVSPRNDGGQHLWWRLPDGATFPHSPLLPGVDRPWQVPVPPSMRLVVVDQGAKGTGRREDFRPYRWTAGDPRALPIAPEALLGAPAAEVTQDGSAFGGEASSPIAGNETDGDGVAGLARVDVPVGEQSYTFKRMACSLIARGYEDETIVGALMYSADHSDVGDPDNPWTERDIRPMVQHARRYIERSRQAEAATNAQFARNLTRRFK